jgi:hypothetical protein
MVTVTPSTFRGSHLDALREAPLDAAELYRTRDLLAVAGRELVSDPIGPDGTVGKGQDRPRAQRDESDDPHTDDPKGSATPLCASWVVQVARMLARVSPDARQSGKGGLRGLRSPFRPIAKLD